MKLAIYTAMTSAVALAVGFTTAHAQSTTINGGGATSSAPVYEGEFDTYTAATPSILFSYDAVSSGAGQTAFLNNDISQFNVPSGQYGTIVGTTVHFGASDNPLSSTQVSGYTRAATDGPLIQIPTFGTAVAIAFQNTGLGTVLGLNDNTLCGIFSGKLSNWSQISKTATKGTIAVIYRNDSSAQTFLLTQHFNKVCTSANSIFATLPVPVTKTFQTLFPGSIPPSNFTGVSGSSGEATTLLATPLSIGFISPDYTSIAPHSAETTSLPVAKLTNATTGVGYTPTVNSIELGLANAGPGSTNASPPVTVGDAANPLLWVPTIPVTNKGYPIVGYSTWDLSSCYSNATVASNINKFLTNQYTKGAYQKVITNGGSAPLINTAASPYVNAVRNIFLSNKAGFNLNINNATLCAGKAGR